MTATPPGPHDGANAMGEPEPPAPARPSAKSDAATVAARVEVVFRIVLDGAQFHDVVQHAAGEGWGVSERQVRTYLQRANALLKERLERSRSLALARHLAQRLVLYARAVNAADYRTALAVLMDDARLRGLYESDKDVRALVRLAADQGERIKQLEARLGRQTT